jgi:hypothetical protein
VHRVLCIITWHFFGWGGATGDRLRSAAMTWSAAATSVVSLSDMSGLGRLLSHHAAHRAAMHSHVRGTWEC